MKARPIFGPDARAGHYATRPVELPGWRDLWDAVYACDAGLVIIDTAMSSFAGDSTKVPAVRDYLSVVELEAEVRGCGVLVLGHSTKKVRQDNDDARKGRRGNGDARKAKKAPDPFNFGHIAGRAAWIDGGRAALTLSYVEEVADEVMWGPLPSRVGVVRQEKWASGSDAAGALPLTQSGAGPKQERDVEPRRVGIRW